MQRRIAVVDNYDSFTYNLVQYLECIGASCIVMLNDSTTPLAIEALEPDGILLSPGPGTPDSAGITLEVIDALAAKLPILGICLGHQAIAQSFGGKVIRADRLFHGKSSQIHHLGSGLFDALPSPCDAGRYHSLIVERSTLPDCFEVTAWTTEEEVMAIRHRELPLLGVQFHPESVLTPLGMRILRNWMASLP